MDEFEKVDEIDLRELWFIFIKNIKLIAVITLIALIITSVFSFFILDKEYESYTTLMLGKPDDYSQDTSNEITYNDVLLNQKLVTTYSELIKSKKITSEVIDKLDLDMSADALGNLITVNTVNDTEIIKITIRYNDPVLAAQIADTIAEVFMQRVSEMMKIDNVNLIDSAEVHNNPVAPRTLMNLAIALVIGLMAGVFVVFLREYLNTKIKDPKEVETLSKHPVLAVIPHTKLLE